MDIAWLIILFVLGACVGSFLNVVVYRLPRGQSIVFPGSHCPECGRLIRPYDNVPILSWLILRGRCRDCKSPISPRYLIVELATGAILAGLYALYFLVDIRDGAGRFDDAWPTYAAHAALLCGLMVCSMVRNIIYTEQIHSNGILTMMDYQIGLKYVDFITTAHLTALVRQIHIL